MAFETIYGRAIKARARKTDISPKRSPKSTTTEKSNRPKKVSNEPDVRNLLANNMKEAESGTVRLSVCFHKPPSREEDKTQSDPSEQGKLLYDTKGLVFNKKCLCFLPRPPKRGTRRSSLPPMHLEDDASKFANKSTDRSPKNQKKVSFANLSRRDSR